jgi:hypothetical protein
MAKMGFLAAAMLGSFCAAAAAAAPAATIGPVKLVFLKEFPGSTPAYMAIELDRDGNGLYKEAEKDEYPIPFRLDTDEWAAMQDLALKIDNCGRPLESGLKVANMGMKTIRCVDEKSPERKPPEVKFNYTQDPAGAQLHDWFERIAESAQHYLALERAVKFERLGVNQELLLLQAAAERNRVVGYEMFLPLLDRIIKNDSYMHMARERANQMADSIRARKAAQAAKSPNDKP